VLPSFAVVPVFGSLVQLVGLPVAAQTPERGTPVISNAAITRRD